MQKKLVLITGGNGDIATSIRNKLEQSGEFHVKAPGKGELNLLSDQDVYSWGDRYYDVIINCAGYILPSFVGADEYIVGLKMHNKVNLESPQMLSSLCIKNNKDAIIINVGSTAGTKNRAEWSAYCSSKAGLIMATKCMADEGIKAICISPGRTNTKMRRALVKNENQDTLLSPDDVADIVIDSINGKYDWGTNIEIKK